MRVVPVYTDNDETFINSLFSASIHVKKYEVGHNNKSEALRIKYLKRIIKGGIYNKALRKPRVVTTMSLREQVVTEGNVKWTSLKTYRIKDFKMHKLLKTSSSFKAGSFEGDMIPIWQAFVKFLNTKVGPPSRMVMDEDVQEHFGYFWFILRGFTGVAPADVPTPAWAFHPRDN